MKEVFIKRYGWLKILKQDGNYALCELKNGGKMCYNIAGHEIRNNELTLF